VRRVMSESTSVLVKGMMRAVVQYGTAADINTDRIDIAGKTGTAEKIDAGTGKYVHGLFNSSFMGMVPVDRPEYVCLVILDEPSQLKYGGQSAAPIFREIVDRVMASPEFPLARMARDVPETKGLAVGKTAPAPVRVPEVPANEIENARASDPVAVVASAGGARHALPAAVAVSKHAAGTMPGMPDLSEHTLRDALFLLKDLGLEVEYNGAGRVIRQEPSAGASIKPGQKCVLTLGWMG
jgi:cell division protein FtsI (penicillin-binding protein 3)